MIYENSEKAGNAAADAVTTVAVASSIENSSNPEQLRQLHLKSARKMNEKKKKLPKDY